MDRKLKIIFISHDSTLTGAPILLFNLVQLIASANRYNISIVLYRGGSLEKKFGSVLPVYVVKPANYSQKAHFIKKVAKYLHYRIRFKKVLAELATADVVFNNTVANGKFLKKISKLNIPVVSYIHELETIIKSYSKDGNALLTFKNSDLFLYPSEAVKTNLVLNHSISANKFTYLPYYFQSAGNYSRDVLEKFKSELFALKSIPSRRFYVVGMGTATHRKGIDLFVETCHKCKQICPNVGFVWIGKFEDAATEAKITNSIINYQLENMLVITGQIEHSAYNLSPFDVLFLSSREDPYPLVVLEAALLKIPSIYFKNTGGIGEFVSPNAGWAIDSFDVNQAAEKIGWLSENKDQVMLRGENAYEKANRIHANPDIIINRFSEIVNEIH